MSFFSLVSTVYNESSRLSFFLSDLENQSLKPAQIVIADAGSTDGTYESLLDWGKKSLIEVVVLQKPRCTIAEGRNLAIEKATNDLIVSTDFGCRLHVDWLKSVVTPFDDPSVQVVGGRYTVEENSLTSLPARANYILTNGYHIALDASFIPSSRSIAYYKSVWKEAGGYCEWLTLAADDLVFGMVLKKNGHRFTLVDKPYVCWGRHESMKAYAKESYRYGLGDGEAKVNRRNTVVNLTELVFRYIFFLIVFLFLVNIIMPFIHFIYFLAGIFFLPGFRSYHRAWINWQRLKSTKYNWKVFAFCAPMIEVTRWNYLKGYFQGYFSNREKVRIGSKRLSEILG